MSALPVPDGDLDEFRRRARSFLSFHTAAGAPQALDVALVFQGALHAAGLAGLSVAPAYGGQGLPAWYETAWREEAARFPLMTEELSITLGNCLPTLLEFGTESQRRRHVPRILSGREVWCQLFSEPGAGSDLAGVETRAVPVPGGWRVNGQKVWTTLAHRAAYGILLARTDPGVSKHAGLSMFIVDLRSPGVEIRPIHQLDGARHFDEVFLTDVPVPADALLLAPGDGWRIASAMLHHQRVARARGQREGVRHDRTDRLVAEFHQRRPPDPTLRDELARLYTAEVCQSLLVSRSLATAGGADPGPIGSLGKLMNALVAPRFAQLAWRIVGPDALAWQGPPLGGEGAGLPAAGAEWARDALFTLSLSIAGGTNEIQRTIIGERVLGLPREPSPAGAGRASAVGRLGVLPRLREPAPGHEHGRDPDPEGLRAVVPGP
jgi:alkylation response protein AidB-like acyl-CoA dehydrogenase